MSGPTNPEHERRLTPAGDHLTEGPPRRALLLVALLLLSMVGPAAAAPAGATYSPPTDADTPIVSTRGHYYETWTGGVARSADVGPVQIDTTGDVPGLESGDCPEEILIYVHGFQNDEEAAIENFNLARASLREEGYTHPVVGFSWDSDTGITDFSDANEIAARNGKKLAQLIKLVKCSCEDTKVRLVSHSLGARVVLNAVQSLHEDALWNSDCACGEDKRVASVHGLGAAVDNEEVAKGHNYGKGYGYFGNAIEAEVGEFHNFFNYEDNVLSGTYALGKLLGAHLSVDQALGENGADVLSYPYLPDNYNQHDVTERVGDDHSGYAKAGDDGGVMDQVVRYIRAQNALERVESGRDDDLESPAIYDDDTPLPVETWEAVCDAVEDGPVAVEFDPAELTAGETATFEARPDPLLGEFAPDRTGLLEVAPFPARLDPASGRVVPVGGEYLALLLMLELGGPPEPAAGSDAFPPDAIRGDLILDDGDDTLLPGSLNTPDGVVVPEFLPENVSVHEGTPIPLSETERELDGPTRATFVPDDPAYDEVPGVYDPETWRFVPREVPPDLGPVRGSFSPVVGAGLSPAYEVHAAVTIPRSEVEDEPTLDGLSDDAYRWTFGDGTTATGRVVEHTFDVPGQVEVGVTVDLTTLPFSSEPGTPEFTEEWLRRGGSIYTVHEGDGDHLLEELKRQTDAYNENVDAIPGLLRGMVADERINAEIALEDGGTLDLAIGTDGSASVTEFREGSFERPTQVARTDEATARDIADAEDPGQAALDAVNDGRVTWEGRGGPVEQAKVAVTKVVIRVYAVISDVLG